MSERTPKAITVLLVILLAMAAAACREYDCPRGYWQKGDTCYRIKDAGAEGGVEGVLADGGGGQDGGSAVVVGDDDSGTEQDPTGSLARPEIQAAASMAPGRELWTWTVPAGTDYFELLLDGVAAPGGENPEEPRFSGQLELGDHTLEVRACTADQRCSEWASHTARIENFGQGLPRGLRDTSRAIPATVLGHHTAIGCNDCADGPNAEIYNLEQAAASMERAIGRGADLIELNVASIGGALYASPADSSSAGARPLLADLLRREKIADADALLVLEVVEEAAASQAAPQDLAEMLFSIIDDIPSVARNGRPLWLRTSYANRGYLQALVDEAERHAVTGPYVRFIVSDPGRDPATFYGAADDALIPDLDFVDAVSVDFRLPNLPYRLERIRASGSAVVVENVPGPGHGEIVLGALRELADAFITDYRVDQARTIVTKPDTGAFFGAKDISADGRILTIRGIRRGAALSWERELGQSFEDYWFGASVLSLPVAVLERSDGELFGRYLSFDATSYYCVVVAVDPSLPRESSVGFLLSFMGTLPDLDASVVMFGSPPAMEGDAAWNVAVGTGSGALGANFATPEPGQNALKNRAVIRVPAQAGSGCMSRNRPFTDSLKEAEPRWIVLAYDGSDLTFFVDGRCAGTARVFDVEGEDDVAATTMVGSGIFGASYFGFAQQFGALRWIATNTDSQN